jgi:peroxiredoxin Q/BCP
MTQSKRSGTGTTRAASRKWLLAALVPAAALAIVLGFVILRPAADEPDANAKQADASPEPVSTTQSVEAAPPFTLSALDGIPVSLADFRDDKNVLLYFSEAADCPPGWQQTQDLQNDLDRFGELDVRVFVVMFEGLDTLRAEAGNRGLSRVPILSDPDLAVTRSYGALGGMHADKPRHAFVLIDKSGSIRWRWDYAGEDVTQMYVSGETVFQQVTQALQPSS